MLIYETKLCYLLEAHVDKAHSLSLNGWCSQHSNEHWIQKPEEEEKVAESRYQATVIGWQTKHGRTKDACVSDVIPETNCPGSHPVFAVATNLLLTVQTQAQQMF